MADGYRYRFSSVFEITSLVNLGKLVTSCMKGENSDSRNQRAVLKLALRLTSIGGIYRVLRSM